MLRDAPILAQVQEYQARERGGTSIVDEIGKVCSVELEGEVDQLYSTLWSDNSWIMSESTRGLERMMEEFIEVVFRNGMEPKQESSWWTSTHVGPVCKPKVFKGALALRGGFRLAGVLYKRSWRCEAGVGRSLKRGTHAGFQDSHVYKPEMWLSKMIAGRLVNHVCSVATSGSVNCSSPQEDEESERVGNDKDEGVFRFRLRFDRKMYQLPFMTDVVADEM